MREMVCGDARLDSALHVVKGVSRFSELNSLSLDK